MYAQYFLKALFLVALLAGSAGVLSACNTIGGFGEDVEEAGEAIEGGAEEVEPY